MTAAAPEPRLRPTDGIAAVPPHPAVAGTRGLVWAYFALQFVLNFANGAITQFLIPFQVDVIDEADKVVNLGIISTAGAVTSIVALPVAGWLSDGTRSRWGRRAPWLVGGLTALAAVVAAFALATSIAALLLLAVALTVAYSTVAAPLFAVLADRTPPESRGTVAAVGGLGMWIGILSGVLVATALSDHVSVAFLVLAAATLLGVPVARGLRRDSSGLPRPPRSSFRAGLRRFWISPRQHPDFAWAFVARVVMFAGYGAVAAYLLYTLQDYIGLGRDRATDLIPAFSVAAVLAILVAVYPAGRISDRIGRRKAPVIAASLLMSASALLPIVVPTLAAFITSFVITGFGFGIYLAVDQALMTMVLPSEGDAGKDLGILNVAQSAGQMVAPLIGSVAISLVGYEALFAVASLLALVGALAIVPIRSVR